MAKAKKDDLPAMQFYTGDWFKAGDVRSLTLEQRGIWADMLFYMWESNERGYLVDASSNPYTTEELSRMIGLPEDLLKQNLKQMESKKIFSVRESDGAIYCRRMVRDQRIREIRKEVGKLGGISNKEKNLLKQNGKQNTKQITEIEDEDEDSSFKEGGTGETKLDPPEERVSEYGGPAYKDVKEFFVANKRTADEALVFWNEYEGKHWYVIGKEDAPKRKMKTTKEWMMKAEQWFVKARKEELDKPKNNIQTKTENSTYEPVPGYKHKISPLCECGCGKPWTMILREDEKSPYFRVASKECFQKCVSRNKSAFEQLSNSMNAALTKTTKLSKTKQEVV